MQAFDLLRYYFLCSRSSANIIEQGKVSYRFNIQYESRFAGLPEYSILIVQTAIYYSVPLSEPAGEVLYFPTLSW